MVPLRELYFDQEEVDSEDDEGLEAGVAARDEARRFIESISARPRGAKCDDGANDGGRPKEDDNEELDASRNGAMARGHPGLPSQDQA